MLPLYAGIFLVSAAMLFFEITLTRLFSVMQWYHFAFISVSVALLGFGASGTWLALRPRHRERTRTVLNRLAAIAALFSISILIAYLAINYVPFDSYRVALERRQLLYLALYYPALILPFFFAGLCVGLPLAAWPGRANAVYAANLAGSAVGSLAVLALVPLLGGAGAVICAGVLGMVAAIVFTLGAPAPRRDSARRPHVRLVYLVLLATLLVLLIHPPALFTLRISPYKTLSTSLLFPQAHLVFSRWNAFSRVDVVESAGIHSAPGLSLSFTGELPHQVGLLADAANLSPITCIQGPDDERFVQYLPTVLPFLLRPGARALVIEPRGGLDLLTALHSGATSVVALESNPLVVEAVREQLRQCDAAPYDDHRVAVVFEEARSYLRRSTEQFDVLLLSLVDTYQPVTSGAYSLSESYAYTEEAVLQYLKRLREEGVLVITRWMQSPPSEEVRACALLAEALERAGYGDPSERIIAFRSWSTATILAKRAPFRSEEIAMLKDFCAERNFDLIYYKGMAATEANRYNVLPDTAHYDSFQSVLSGTERPDFLSGYPYEVSPPSDDRPFFFHYFRWGQTESILRSLGKTWQPFGGSGFLILVVLLALAVVLSIALILLPLAARGTAVDFRSLSNFGSLSLKATLLYFACLGLGFLFVEMPLLQQFILFLGQPAYSFSLVLFSILLFSGLGSALSARLPLRPLLLVLVVVVLAYPSLLSRLFVVSIGLSLPLRLIVAVLSLGPLGFLLGLPLPGGIRLLEKGAPELIPWAWAVNGCASVLSSILAVMGAVTFGFSRVLAAGALAYLVAWFTVLSLQPRSKTEMAA
jgi:hypothetical protein